MKLFFIILLIILASTQIIGVSRSPYSKTNSKTPDGFQNIPFANLGSEVLEIESNKKTVGGIPQAGGVTKVNIANLNSDQETYLSFLVSKVPKLKFWVPV